MRVPRTCVESVRILRKSWKKVNIFVCINECCERRILRMHSHLVWFCRDQCKIIIFFLPWKSIYRVLFRLFGFVFFFVCGPVRFFSFFRIRFVRITSFDTNFYIRSIRRWAASILFSIIDAFKIFVDHRARFVAIMVVIVCETDNWVPLFPPKKKWIRHYLGINSF